MGAFHIFKLYKWYQIAQNITRIYCMIDNMLAKLKAYGFSTDVLNLMHSYLKNRKQKVQINSKFSLERNVIVGVPQGSIDGPLLFNLFINGLVFFIQYSVLSNYILEKVIICVLEKISMIMKCLALITLL